MAQPGRSRRTCRRPPPRLPARTPKDPETGPPAEEAAPGSEGGLAARTRARHAEIHAALARGLILTPPGDLAEDNRAALAQITARCAELKATRDLVREFADMLCHRRGEHLEAWCLARVIWVADRGFTSAENRRYLRKGGGHYIVGEKLRSGSAEAAAALSRQGGYKDVAGNLKVKEVRIAEDERFVICFNPEAAERDAAIRARDDRPARRRDQGL
jgi:hypothetical protein